VAYFALVGGGVAFVGLTDWRPELVIRVKVGLVNPRDDSLSRQSLTPLSTLVGHALLLHPGDKTSTPEFAGRLAPPLPRCLHDPAPQITWKCFRCARNNVETRVNPRVTHFHVIPASRPARVWM
jgi:hypothetical protein